jgi:nucleoid-associated protein YgaU
VKSRIEIPFYREEPAKVATVTVAAEPPKPVEVASIEVAPAPAPVTEVAEVATPEAPAEPAAVAETPVVEETAVVATQVPAEQTAGPELASAPPTQVIIQPGNNLWKLSRQIYGKGIMYTVIYEANKDQIRKPELIYPGQIFLTPDASATTGQ